MEACANLIMTKMRRRWFGIYLPPFEIWSVLGYLCQILGRVLIIMFHGGCFSSGRKKNKIRNFKLDSPFVELELSINDSTTPPPKFNIAPEKLTSQ